MARNLVVVVLDSLRHDSWLEAEPSALTALGPVERRFSYASWTAPSHYNLLMGLLPHTSPTGVYASTYYRQDLARYAERLDVPGVDLSSLLPSLWLPSFLRDSLGYRTRALVSMPVLNHHTPLNTSFDGYELMPSHNDMAAMLPRLEFSDERPSSYLLNVGETHYPYALPHEDASRLPHLQGLHGVVGDLDPAAPSDHGGPAFFDAATLRELHARQVEAVRYLDGVFARLFDLLPTGTWVVVTSDHGELFGEQGYFGHGPINHEKVLEVPFVEGVVP